MKEENFNSAFTCSCGCCDGEKHEHHIDERSVFLKRNWLDLLKIILSATLLLASFFIDGVIKIIILAMAFALSGYEIFIKAIKGVGKKNFFNENLLMLVASVTAFIIGEYFEGVVITLLFTIGEFFEHIVTKATTDRIAGLAKLKSNFVRVIKSKEILELPPENVEIGSYIEVRKGEIVPIDGILLSGEAVFDMKSITGESLPNVCKCGQKVFSGSINLGDAIVIKTIALHKDSTVEKIIELVKESVEKKAKSQKLINKFAKYYTPIVMLLGVLIAVGVPLFDNFNFTKWIYKGLNFLVVSCPCAIVISVPLAYFIGIGSLAKKGVLVKGSIYIDVLSKIQRCVFDKTGTLTKGKLKVNSVDYFNGYNFNDVGKIIYALESKSTHPIGNALKDYFSSEKCNFNFDEISEKVGKGILGKIADNSFYLGNEKYLADNNVEIDKTLIKDNYSVVYMAINNKLAVKITLADEIKVSSVTAIKNLKKIGIKDNFVLSGDKEQAVKKICSEVDVENYYYELLPNEKTEKLKDIMKDNSGFTLYCGDGINDSPSIAVADVGVAMGGLGSSIAIENADVVIFDDDLNKIPYTINRSKKIKNTVLTNIFGSILVKFIILICGLFFPLPVYISMLADTGLMILAILNSLLLYKI